MADPGARRHTGHVGDGQQLGRQTVETGTGWADPHADRHVGVGDVIEQIGHLVAADDSALRVDLQDERLGVVVGCPVDRLGDRRHLDRVDQPADLQHVDRGQVGRGVLGVGGRDAKGVTDQQGGGGHQQADR